MRIEEIERMPEEPPKPGKLLPGGIGLRLCEIYFALVMVLYLVFGAICPRDMFTYDISLLRILILMAGGAATLWLMSRRARSARVVGPITALVCAALSGVDHAAFGAYGELETYIGHIATIALMAVEYLGAIAVSVYLIFSHKARRELWTQADMVHAPKGSHSWDKPLKERIRTWIFWRDLLIYFVVFSLVGHWAEILFCQLIVAGVFMGGYDPTNTMLWSQWLYPFSAEGTALVAVVIILHPVARWLYKKTGNRIVLAIFLSFLLNMAVCTLIDFSTGMVANQNYELWDYRDMPFNFMGQVCLQNSLVYSIAATLIVWGVYPLMDTALRRAPRGVIDAVAFGLLGMYLFLAMLHFITP